MKLKGWKNVFSFTFIQQVKTKSFIISTVIIALIIAIMAALADILPAVFLQGELDRIESAASDGSALSVSKLYISDESGLSVDLTAMGDELGISVENITASQADAKAAELETGSEKAMLVRILREEGFFSINASYAGGDSGVNRGDCENIANIISQQVQAGYLTSLGVPAEELITAMSGIPVTVTLAGKAPTSVVEDAVNTIVPMVGSLVLFIFIFAYSQLIAQAIATEKSSRVMEYLLTSVSPLSIIVGKVLAICLVSLLQFIIMTSAGALGFLVSMPFGIFSKMDSITAAAAGGAQAGGSAMDINGILNDITAAFSTVNIMTIVVIIITFILGFLFYALLAGLAGASISKMEDLSAAIQPMSIIGVLGFYLAYMPQIGAMDGGEANILMIIARYLPISSPFCLPSAYMLGQMSLPEVLIALVLLAACVLAMCMLVAKVYEHIVLYTGDRLKISDMLKMAK